MSDHVIKTIEQFKQEIEAVEATIKPKKLLVNQLCDAAGIQRAYTEIDTQPTGATVKITRNAFFGQPLSTCIRKFLEMRANLQVREASLDEIVSALREGGYDLKTSGATEDDQKRGVAIALGKNSQTFHRLPTGDYGLLAWYPNIKERKSKPDTVSADKADPVEEKAEPSVSSGEAAG